MPYTSIIIRTGIQSINWNNTVDVHTWGLPDTVKEPTINRINTQIRQNGGIVVWFLSPNYKKEEGRFIASCIIREEIREIIDTDLSDENLQWISNGSNTLGVETDHIFKWRFHIGDLLELEKKPNIMRSAVVAHNGLDIKGNAKQLTRQTVHFPTRGLQVYLADLFEIKWRT